MNAADQLAAIRAAAQERIRQAGLQRAREIRREPRRHRRRALTPLAGPLHLRKGAWEGGARGHPAIHIRLKIRRHRRRD